jgi:polyhydroxyalkanoate synthesis regulator phasin
MNTTVDLRAQIKMQASRLAVCIGKINKLTSDLHHSQKEVERLKAEVKRLQDELWGKE